MNLRNNRTVDGAAPIQQASAAPPAFHPQIVRSVRMHPMLAAGVGGFVFLALLGYGLTRKPTYKAESLVYEEPAAAKLMSDGTAGSFDPSRYDSYLDQQKQVISRPDVLSAAIATLPPPVWHELGPSEQAAVASLQAQLKADRVKTSYQLAIDLESRDPQAAAAIVNAVTKSYLERVHKETAAQSDQRALLLAEERNRIEAEMQTTRQEQAGLSASLGVASPAGETANPYDFEIAGVREQLLTARQAHDVAASQLNSISGGAGDAALTAAADDNILGDPALASMRATVASRRATLNEQMAGMKSENPVYRQDLDELADLDKSLDNMTRQLRGKAERQLQEKLRTELERTGDVESRMNAQLARLTATATTAAPKLQRATELSQDLTRLNTRYAAVDDALRSLRLEANGPGVVRLSLAAAVPSTPEPNRKMLLLAAAPVCGLLFGIAAAVLARKRDRRVYSARDLEDILGFAPMAVLPAKNDVSARVMDEYVLRLAAGLESAYRGSGAQTFLLTAASPATDIRPLRKALTATLERIGLSVAVARTTDLLLADPVAANEHQIARSSDGAGFVANHLANLKNAHAIIIINAPPLGTSAETEYVARCADATILVAESGVTTHEELFESARLLQRLEARGVGAVLQELELRLAGESFRQAVEAVEQRQPDLYHSTVRSRPVVVGFADDEMTENYVMKREHQVESPEPVTDSEPSAAAAPPDFVETSPQLIEFTPAKTEAAVETPTVEEVVASDQTLSPVASEVLSQGILDAPGLHLVEPSHEKIAPQLSGSRETSFAGGPPMSDSRNWFQRMLQHDEQKVSILPDGDEDEPVDEASCLTSRVSRSTAAYETPSVREPKFEEASAQRVSRRFVIEDLCTAQSEPEPEQIPIALATETIEAQLEPSFVAPVSAAEPATAVAGASAHEPTIVDLSATRLLSRLRPARPLSFHQLQALAVQPAAIHESASGSLNALTEDEMVHAVELPQEFTPTEQVHTYERSIEEDSTYEEPAHEFVNKGSIDEEAAPEALPLEVQAVAPEIEERASDTVGEPVPEQSTAAVDDVGTTPEEDAAWEIERAGSITKEIARLVFATPSGTGRWDPIPPLRPTDSGWNRVQAIDAGNGSGNGSNGATHNGVERRRSEERSDQTWANRDEDAPLPIDAGAQRWAEQAANAESDEPALSRPWGLLSRFQQTHLITPVRMNGNGASGKGRGAEDHERDLEQSTFQPKSNG